MRKAELEAKTKRLAIRPYTLADYLVWREGYLGRRPKHNEFDQGPVRSERVSKAAFSKIVRLHGKARECDRLYVFGVFERKTKRHVGFLDLYVQARLDFQCANLGYAIHNQFWGRGYAKEASAALIRLAFNSLRIHRIEAGVDPRNKASIAVAKAIGMKREGVRRSCVFEGHAWRDLRYYAVIPEDVGLKSSPPFVKTSLNEIL